MIPHSDFWHDLANLVWNADDRSSGTWAEFVSQVLDVLGNQNQSIEDACDELSDVIRAWTKEQR